MYNYLIYAKPGFLKGIEEIHPEMESFFEKFHYEADEPKPAFHLQGTRLCVSCGDYNFYIEKNEEPAISEELKEILEGNPNDLAGNPVDKNKLLKSAYRFELWGDDDPDMDYFNESLFIVEFFEKNDNYVIFAIQ